VDPEVDAQAVASLPVMYRQVLDFSFALCDINVVWAVVPSKKKFSSKSIEKNSVNMPPAPK